MNASEIACAPGHEAAIEWALRRMPAARLERITENNWACTYRLVGASQDLYLKVVPATQRAAIERVVAVASDFSAEVPAVIAADADRGWILVADHGGRTPVSDDEYDELLEVVGRYAAMQARASASPALLKCLEAVDPTTAVDTLLGFLAGPADDEADTVGVAYFVGDAEAQRYQRLFGARASLLRAQVARAASLPITISHGDLHRWNVAIRDDGSVQFFDWDEVAAGPAGLCMHGLFEGSTAATMLLAQLSAGAGLPETRLAAQLQTYVDALLEHGYGSRAQLLDGLPGALCAGQMRFVASFGRYPGNAQRAASAAAIRTKLSDLLDLCDLLASRDIDVADRCIADYAQGRDWRRAHRLLQDRLSKAPDDLALVARYGEMCWRLGDVATADEAFAEVVAAEPDNGAALAGLARCALARSDVATARLLLDRAGATHPTDPEVARVADRLQRMQAMVDRAAEPDGLPRWSVSDEERADGALAPDTLALVVEMFRRYGIVQLDEVFPAEMIARMQAGFAERYGHHFHDGEHADSLQVGNKRYMLTMELDDLFGRAELVASGLILPFMRRVLGKECILSAYTAVVSLGGSEDQRIHKDHSELFEEEGWPLQHPSFAAQAIVPLLALNPVTGATRIHKGTQRVPLRKCAETPYQDPVVPLGSCVLLDYSVAHYGIGNRSDQVRPILNLIYSRPWFRDCRNYHIQPPLRFSQQYLREASDEIRALVGWWDLERKAASA